MIESHGEHDQRPAHDPMWPGYTSIKELPHLFRRSRTPVHQHGLMPLDPHQSEALCASPYLPYQRIGIAPGIRKTLSQYRRDTPGECFLEDWWLLGSAPRSIAKPIALHPRRRTMRLYTAWCNAQSETYATIIDRRTVQPWIHVAGLWLVDKVYLA